MKQLNTGTKKLILNIETDRVWGNGYDGLGDNVKGHILMRVREVIDHEYQS